MPIPESTQAADAAMASLFAATGWGAPALPVQRPSRKKKPTTLQKATQAYLAQRRREEEAADGGNALQADAKAIIAKKQQAKKKHIIPRWPIGYAEGSGHLFAPGGSEPLCPKFKIALRVRLSETRSATVLQWWQSPDHPRPLQAFIPDMILDEEPVRLASRMRVHGLAISEGGEDAFAHVLRHAIERAAPIEFERAKAQLDALQVFNTAA